MVFVKHLLNFIFKCIYIEKDGFMSFKQVS